MSEIDKKKLVKYLEGEIKTGKLVSKRMRIAYRECKKYAPEFENKWNEIAYWGSGKCNALKEMLDELLYGSFDK